MKTIYLLFICALFLSSVNAASDEMNVSDEVTVTFKVTNIMSEKTSKTFHLLVFRNNEIFMEVEHYDVSQPLTVPAGDDYIFFPISPPMNHKLDCINFNDILVMEQAILGMLIPSSVYFIVAGDVNNSGSVNASDVIATRMYILQDLLFNHAYSGKFFYEKESLEPHLIIGSEIANQLTFFNLQEDITIDFDYFIYGDLDGDCFFDEFLDTWMHEDILVEDDTIKFLIPNVHVTPGSSVQVPVYFEFDHVVDLSLIQFELELQGVDAELEYEGIPWNIENASLVPSPAASVPGVIYAPSPQGQSIFSIIIHSNESFDLLDHLRLNYNNWYVVGYDINNLKYPLIIEETFVIKTREREKGSLSVSALPNPFDQQATLSFEIPQSGLYQVEIFNMQGQVKYRQDFQMTMGTFQMELPGHFLDAAGTYIVRVNSEHFTGNYKIVKL